MKRALEKLGVPILAEIEAPGTVEGGDYVFIDPETLAIGWSGRTNELGLDQIRALLLGSHIKEMVVPSLTYGSGHLDGRLMMVNPTLAVGHMNDLTMYPATVYTHGSAPRFVFMDDYFAERGIDFMEGRANFTIAPDVVLNVKAHRDSTVELRQRGIKVVEIDGEMMRRADSGPHCLTCPLVRT
jgi:N-dimethylarginine dimethylaminohydrolase